MLIRSVQSQVEHLCAGVVEPFIPNEYQVANGAIKTIRLESAPPMINF
jgi:hypothetical protein